MVEFVISESSHWGYEWGEFVKKRERHGERGDKDSAELKQYMIKICSIKLGIQDFIVPQVTIFKRNYDTFIFCTLSQKMCRSTLYVEG